jgi:hypothetical protein
MSHGVDTVGGMAVEQSQEHAALQQAKRRLEAELAQLRRRRVAEEKEAARLPAVRSALATARRGHDAGTHPRLRSARLGVERAVSDYEQLLAAAGRLLARANTLQLAPEDPRVHAVETVVVGEVQEAARAFVAAVNIEDDQTDAAGGAR